MPGKQNKQPITYIFAHHSLLFTEEILIEWGIAPSQPLFLVVIESGEGKRLGITGSLSSIEGSKYKIVSSELVTINSKNQIRLSPKIRLPLNLNSGSHFSHSITKLAQNKKLILLRSYYEEPSESGDLKRSHVVISRIKESRLEWVKTMRSHFGKGKKIQRHVRMT